MAYSAIIQFLDRLSVRSVLRGSTSTIWGIIGTLAVFILCLSIYIPPTMAYFRGIYFESQFYTQDLVNQTFYSNDDFKIAIEFRKKTDNSVANHAEILTWAYSQWYQLLADWSDGYYEPSSPCKTDYLLDAINPVKLTDCFIFPQHAPFHAFPDYGYYTAYTNIFYWLYPKQDPSPFASTYGGPLKGYRLKMDLLLQNYYYIVYFTSKLINPSTGKPQFQINRFFSSSTTFNSDEGAKFDLVVYNVKKYSMDNSIMPWRNNITKTCLVWLGDVRSVQSLSPDQAASNGIQVDFSLYKYNIVSYQYYKKLDWLIGIIGGGMLLFYLILWAPCTYINSTIHKMRNTNQLLLLKHSQQGKPVTRDKVTAVNVSKFYWLSNFVTNYFFKRLQSAHNLVFFAEQELDIIRLIKKLKVAERNLTKKQLLPPFKQKILKISKKINNNDQSSVIDQSSDARSQIEHLDNQDIQDIVQEDFVDIPTDPTYGLPQSQMHKLQNNQLLHFVYQNNMTANVIMDQASQTIVLEQMDNKNKFYAEYQSKKKEGFFKVLWNYFVIFIKKFDMFGARPNLTASPFGSSLVGLCGVITIITLSILTVALTIQNANSQTIMALNSFQDEQGFGYTLQTGSTLKFAVCFDLASQLVGSNRKANLRFFTQNKAKGRQYIPAVQLSASDYALFDLTSSTSPVNIAYCYGISPNYEVPMGQNDTNYGYFGFRVEPFCSSTASYCSSNAQSINDNFLKFINTTGVYLFLPQNRFDPIKKKFVHNLIQQQLNINYRYMDSTSAFEQSVFVDQVRILDDTKNWFVRKDPKVRFSGISLNQNSPYSISKNIPNSLYYQTKIKASSNQVNYVISTKKADIILGIIGGVFIFWYAICHWLGKIYNNYNVRAKLAEELYAEDAIDQNIFIKLLALSPIPNCCFPRCFYIKNDVMRLRQIQKKIKNDLCYLWLVKYVDNVYNLSSSIFDTGLPGKNLSLVFVKEKVDESQQVRALRQRQTNNIQQQFQDLDDDEIAYKLGGRKGNKILNQSVIQKRKNQYSNENMPVILDQKQKHSKIIHQEILEDQPKQNFLDNYINGNPKQPRFNWLDTFEYPASLTYKGEREVNSFCGGCFCIIMTLLILLVAYFQVKVYLNLQDARVGRATDIMQPLSSQANSTFNSQLLFRTGENFKLAVTFSSAYKDYPQDITNWTNSAVGIAIYDQTFTKKHGQIITQTNVIPMIPCDRNYLTSWLDPIVDPSYYSNTQLGFCVPNGLILEISGLPEDTTTRSFTFSIYNKFGTSAGNQELKLFMQKYLPKFHFSVPTLNFTTHKIQYTITSLVFDAFNVTYPNSQNISLAKTTVHFDDQVAFEGDPYSITTYGYFPFQQKQTGFNDFSNQNMSYNLSFANSYLVQSYTVQGDKFYQTWGIIGGIIALFIFGCGIFPRSFNQYYMNYLIGKQLYLFDILKKKQAMALARGRRKKSNDELRELSNYNNMNEGQVLMAYLMSLFGGIFGNYNLNTTLRRVTLIQQRVQKDMDIYNFYKKLHNIRDSLNKNLSSKASNLAGIYLKHFYNVDDRPAQIAEQKILSFAKKHNLSNFQQYAVSDALLSHVNIKEIFDNAFLEKVFHLSNLEQNRINLSQFGGTQGSIGTNSVVQPSQLEQEFEKKI